MLQVFVVCCALFVVTQCEVARSDLATRCDTCRGIVSKFKEGLVKTAKSNFGGGNTHWEEKNLGSYAFSETRLLEILENVCERDSQRECHHMLESKEDVIENWWFKHYAKGVDTDLNYYLCVSRMKACCPNGTFGMDCRECDGGRTKPCKGNGHCDGDGTRVGSGNCMCDVGYTGRLCDSCIDGFYEDSKAGTSGQPVCTQCHGSCKLTCSERGPLGCDDCRDGWLLSDEDGCVDENECEDDIVCDESEFCLNTEGSYKCITCNKACNTCSGSTASDCLNCATKFYRDASNVCRPCHVSCESTCTNDMSESCDSCAKGWSRNAEPGPVGPCQDINECLIANGSLCSSDEYCVNTVGSYKCATCHPSCLSCTSAGNEQCVECKPGYSFSDKHQCLDIDECSTSTQPVCNKPHEKCVNTPGSFKCSCESGYAATSDGCQLQSDNQSPRTSNAKSNAQKAKTSSSSDTKSPIKTSSNTKIVNDFNKKTKKPTKQKEKEKVVRDTAYKYVAGLFCFVVFGIALKKYVIGQTIAAAALTVYLSWLSNIIDRSISGR